VGRAEDLRDRLELEGTVALEQLYLDRESENQWLDFKNVSSDFAPKILGSNNLKNFSKAVSGFANGPGGVIVWGVDCRNKGQGDFIQSRKPINNPEAFVSLLEDAVSKATLPPHSDGIHSFILPGDPGFVCTYVPTGTDIPYRSVQEDQYFLRSGSAFRTVPHDVLAGMFGREPKPDLNIYISRFVLDAEIPGFGAEWFRAEFDLEVCNDGLATAHDVVVVSEIEDRESFPFGSTLIDRQRYKWYPRNGKSGIRAHTLMDPMGIAPYASLPFARCAISISNQSFHTHRVTLRLGAKGTKLKRIDMGFSGVALKELYKECKADHSKTSIVPIAPIKTFLARSFGHNPDEITRGRFEATFSYGQNIL